MDITIRFPVETTATQIRQVLQAGRIYAMDRQREAVAADDAMGWAEARNALGDAMIHTYVQDGDPDAQP